MKENDEEGFANILMMLAEVFEGGVISQLKVEVYFQALKQYDLSEIKRAAGNIIRERVYSSYPKPGEIAQEISGTKEDVATIAWLKALDGVKRIGNYQSVRFDDPIIHSVIEIMGGWEQLCLMETKDEKWRQKEFERLYTVIAAQPSNKHPKYLPGTSAMRNAEAGFPDHNKIVEIGAAGIKLLEGGQDGASG